MKLYTLGPAWADHPSLRAESLLKCLRNSEPSHTAKYELKTWISWAGVSTSPPPIADAGPLREDTKAASISGNGWDSADDLADQLSSHGINGASRAASMDSRATSYQEAKAWQSDDDWGDDEPPPAPRPKQTPISSEGKTSAMN